MEESVWLYFGVLSVLIVLGILVGVFQEFRGDADAELFFQSVKQLGAQASHVCNSPRETKLSIEITVPMGALLSTDAKKLCGEYEGEISCVPSECAYNVGQVLDLTAPEIQGLFDSQEFRCTIEHQDMLLVTCEG